jgi:hypothetical protein
VRPSAVQWAEYLKAPQARYSVAAAVRPWIRKRQDDIEARTAVIFNTVIFPILVPHLRRSSFYFWANHGLTTVAI